MAEYEGWAAYCWARRRPLELNERPASATMLGFWIKQSARDPWAFNDLLRLVGEAMDEDGALPLALQRWGLEVATGRRQRPKPRGPAGAPWNDLVVTAFVELLVDACGMSQRQAFREIAATLNKSPQAVETARRRALRL